MTSNAWRTTHVTARTGPKTWAVCRTADGRRIEYPADAYVLQTDHHGATRTVLAFRDGANLLTAEELPGFRRVVDDDWLCIEDRAEDLRHEAAHRAT